ncbi:MAG TPA: DMT family transporter, partial [Actinomycetota bacterium]|nr:DMT family transporter [Actinomycetota bacterium]
TLAVGGGLVALVGLPAAVRQDWGALTATDWLIMVFAIVGPVYLAYALWNWAIHKRGIARTTVYGFAVPVVAAVLAVIFLGETLHPEQIVGGLMVVAGLVVTRMPSRRRVAMAAGPPEVPSSADEAKSPAKVQAAS